MMQSSAKRSKALWHNYSLARCLMRNADTDLITADQSLNGEEHFWFFRVSLHLSFTIWVLLYRFHQIRSCGTLSKIPLMSRVINHGYFQQRSFALAIASMVDSPFRYPHKSSLNKGSDTGSNNFTMIMCKTSTINNYRTGCCLLYLVTWVLF